jgi:predicted metalloprotease with PDZ domain
VDGLVPGDTVRIAFSQRGRERVATVTAVADPALEVVPVEATGRAASAAELSFRKEWLGSRAVP